MGSCALYKCAIETKSGNKLVGYIQNEFYALPKTEKELLNHLQGIVNNDSSAIIKVYSKIQTIEYPKFPHSDKFKYSAVTIEDTQMVKASDIKSINLIRMTSCECIQDEKTGKFAYSKSDFLIKYSHFLIDELTQREIDLLNSRKPIFTHQIQIDKSDMDLVTVLNYNSELTKQEFKILAEKLKFPKRENQTWRECNKLREIYYEKVKRALRKKEIVLILLVNYT
jgi:hypothetical protein